MSTKRTQDVGKENTRSVGRYNLRSAFYRTISANSSSSSDSNFDDSFEQLCRPIKKKIIQSANSTSKSSVCESMIEFLTTESKTVEEECDALDQMFKNIDIQDTSEFVPIDWLEKSEPSIETVNNVQLTTVYEDNESNYRSSKSIDSALISKDSLDYSMIPTQTSKDSLELSEMSKSNIPIELNDTLEDVEYVHDEQDRYLLKPVSKNSKIPNSPISPDGLRSLDTSFILIESSPESNYATSRNELKLLDTVDIKSEFSCDNSSMLSVKTIPSISVDSSRESSTVSINSSSNGSFATARNDLKRIEADCIKPEILDASVMDSCISYPKTASFYELETDQSRLNEETKSSDYYTALSSNQPHSSLSSSSSICQLSVSSARCNTLDDVSSLINDNSTVSHKNHLKVPQTDSNDSSKNFNDSLERMEYMMEQGRKIQEMSNVKTVLSDSPMKRIHDSPASHCETSCAYTLSSATKARIHATPASQRLASNVKPLLLSNSAKKQISASPASQAVTPVTRILKPSNRLPVTKSQSEKKYNSPTISPAFKKPNFPNSGCKKESGRPNTISVSRIPASKNKHFNHIVSPIGAYINNIAAPPLLANVKPTSDFFDSSYCNKIRKELDYSVASVDGGSSKPVAALPMKYFSSSQQQRIIDGKTQKIPGGEKLNRIIGQIPLVISHEGRIHSGSPQKRNEPMDESLADMSVMSGDISVQVVRDVKRQ